MSVLNLANYLADTIRRARDTVGMAERGTIAGNSVITSRGAYSYDAACPITLYDGKNVWVQVAQDGTAVVIGD